MDCFFYVYVGGVGGIGSWGYCKFCLGFDLNIGLNVIVYD